MAVIRNPLYTDLGYLLLQNAAQRGSIRVQHPEQLAVAHRFLAEGYLDERPDGSLIITPRGRTAFGMLNAPTLSSNRKKRRKYLAVKQEVKLTQEINHWKHLAEVRQGVNQRLVKRLRHQIAYGGTTIEIVALRTQMQEQEEIIAGLRQTIARLKGEQPSSCETL